MGSKRKEAGAVLLEEAHRHQTNPWGDPVVGWEPTRQGEGWVNPKGWGIIRITLWKLVNGVKTLLYDQPTIVENLGVIVILRDREGRVGLVRNFRMTSAKRFDNGSSYVRRIQEEERWAEVVESLGEWTWEAPQGLATVADGPLQEVAFAVAKRESRQEAGVELGQCRLLGPVNTNPTFFTHPQQVVEAVVIKVGDAEPEHLEIIGNLQFFTPAEVRELHQKGELTNSLTLSALWLAGI